MSSSKKNTSTSSPKNKNTKKPHLSHFYKEFALPVLQASNATELDEAFNRAPRGNGGQWMFPAESLKEFLIIATSKAVQIAHTEESLASFATYFHSFGTIGLKRSLQVFSSDGSGSCTCQFYVFLDENNLLESIAMSLLPRLVEVSASSKTIEVFFFFLDNLCNPIEHTTRQEDASRFHPAASFIYTESYRSIMLDLLKQTHGHASVLSHLYILFHATVAHEEIFALTPPQARNMIDGFAEKSKCTEDPGADNWSYLILSMLDVVLRNGSNIKLFLQLGLFEQISAELLPSLALNIQKLVLHDLYDVGYSALILRVLSKLIFCERSSTVSSSSGMISSMSEFRRIFDGKTNHVDPSPVAIAKARFLLELVYLVALKGYNVPEYFNRENVEPPFAFFDKMNLDPHQVAEVVTGAAERLLPIPLEGLLKSAPQMQWAVSTHRFLLRHLPESHVEHPHVFGSSFIVNPQLNENYSYGAFAELPKV